jgi:hypothetical protein
MKANRNEALHAPTLGKRESNNHEKLSPIDFSVLLRAMKGHESAEERATCMLS